MENLDGKFESAKPYGMIPMAKKKVHQDKVFLMLLMRYEFDSKKKMICDIRSENGFDYFLISHQIKKL